MASMLSCGLRLLPLRVASEDGVALPDAVVTGVCTLIQEGALRGGPVLPSSRILLSTPPTTRSPSFAPSIPAPSAHELASLDRLRRVAPRAAPSVDPDQVRKALASFPSASGAGPSGLRPSEIREAMRPATSDLLLRLLSEVVDLLLQGEVPDEVRQFARGASIVAWRKPDGAIRPLAISETLRRTTSKVAVDLIADQAREILEPLRLGVKTPNGCEATVHAARLWFFACRSSPDHVAVCVFFRNAFNTVHRSPVLSAVRTHFPSLAPWVDCSYSHDSLLFTGSASAVSRTIGSGKRSPTGGTLWSLSFSRWPSTRPLSMRVGLLFFHTPRASISRASSWTTDCVLRSPLP